MLTLAITADDVAADRTIVALPYELRQEFLKGNVVLFVGAGFVKNYLPAMPLWQDLLKRVFTSLSGDENEIFKYCDPVYDDQRRRVVHPADYLRLAQQFELARERANRNAAGEGRDQVPGIHELVQQTLTDNYDPAAARNAVHQTRFMAAKCLPLPIWVTTNFDTFLEDTFFEDGLTHGTDILLSRPIRNVDFGSASAGGRTLIKIHGSISNREPEQSIVITEEDYYRFLQRDRYIINKLYTLFCERTVVFMGYSLSDPNIQFIYHEVLFDQKAGGSPGDSQSFSQIRPAFFVSNSLVPPEQKAYYKHKRIQYVENCSIERFFEELSSTHATFEQGRAHITEKINADLATYQDWYGRVTFNTNPDDLAVERDDQVSSLSQLLDLVELHEVVYKASGSAVVMPEFDTMQLGLCVLGVLRIARNWCREFLARGRTDVLEILLEFLRHRQGVRKSSFLRSLLIDIEQCLEDFPDVGDIDRFVQRYCTMIQQYDAVYNDWEDYTFCLDQYVRSTRLWPYMSHPIRRRVVQGLYEQLSMCGRAVGDSWFTTNHVYAAWPLFNDDAWPLLEAEIRNNGLTWKNQEMLNHLRPGGDVRLFLPRQ